MASESRSSSTTQTHTAVASSKPKNTYLSGVSSEVSDKAVADKSSTKDVGRCEKAVNGVQGEQKSTAPLELDLNQETWRQTLILVGLLLATVIISIDGTIIVTAVPAITEQFKSIDDVGWYGSVYTLGLVVAQPILGSLYRQLNAKYVLWSSLLIFAVGSIISATAKESYVLIIGRAITGAGGSGLFTGSLVIANLIGRGKRKPFYIALVCSVYGFGCAAGPLIGGGFTDSVVTWRFCFWVNLPIALVTLLATSSYQASARKKVPSITRILRKLDLLGLVPLTVWLVCLLLGINYSSMLDESSHKREIGFLAGFAATFLLFLIQQKFFAYGSDQILSFRILSNRTVAACATSEFFFIMTSRIQIYYLPIYYQTVRSISPLESGVFMLPYLGAMAVSPIFAGIVVGRIQYPQPLIWGGLSIFLIGSGLMYTLDLETSLAFSFGSQVLAGFGLGLAIQTVITTMQSAVAAPDVPLATSLHVFCLSLGPTVGYSVAQALFISQLSVRLRQLDIDPAPFVQGAALATPQVLNFSPTEAVSIVSAYVFGLEKVFLFGLVASSVAFLVALVMGLKRISSRGGEAKK